MRVTVKPEVVAGTDKGGEDLFLVFEATGDVSDTFSVEPLPGDPDWGYDGDGDEDDPKATWSVCSGYYEFKWSGTLEDLAEIARQAGVTCADSWEWDGSCLQEPGKRFHCRHFVGGNAG